MFSENDRTMESGSARSVDETVDSSEAVARIPQGTSDGPTLATHQSVPRSDISTYLPQLEGYEVLGRLGEGGMGVVWKAIQLSTKRPVALKLMSAASFGSERAKLRFEREVELTAKLDHPNIARVFDSGLRQGVFFYAMELVEAALPLDQYAKERGLARREVIALAATVCRAVQHAHQKGVIHRDLKPANILVGQEGQPHVLDFGLAKAMEGGQQLSLDGDVAGTPIYMSPEQAAGHLDQLDTRSDVYTLGVILFYLLCGRFPHDIDGSAIEVMRRIAEQEPKRLSDIEPKIDRELQALLNKAMAREPERRYETAGGLAADLDRYLSGEPLVAQPPTASYLLKKKLQKHRGPIAIAGVVVLALLGLAVLAYVRIAHARTIAVAARHDAEESAGLARLRESEARSSEARAIESETRALASEKKASEERTRADEERQAAESGLASSLVAQGNALGLSSRWDEAVPRYQQAQDLLRKLGSPTTPADLGLWNAMASAPPPIALFHPHPGTPIAVDFMPDGRTVAGVCDSGHFELFDLATGHTTREVTRAFVSKMHLNKVRVLPGGQTAVAGASEGMFYLYDLQSGQSVYSFGEPVARRWTDFDVTTDGKFLLTARSQQVEAYDLSNGKKLQTVRSPFLVWSVAWAPDGHSFFCGAERGSIQQHQFPEDAAPREFHGGGSWVRALAVSPDGQRMVAGDLAGVIRMWELPSGNLITAVNGHPVDVRSLIFSKDSQTLLSAGSSGSVKLWEGRTLRPIRTVGEAGADLVNATLSDDGRTVAVAAAGWIKAWTLDPPPESRVIADYLSKDSATAAFSPDANTVLSIAANYAARLTDLATGRTIVGVYSAGFGRVRVLPDGVHALLANEQHVTFHDVRGGILSVFGDRGVGLKDFIVLPNEKDVVCGYEDGALLQWEIETGRLVKTLVPAGYGSGLRSRLAASSDGNLILAAWGSGLRLLNRAGGGEPALIAAKEGYFPCTAISADGRYGASSYESKTIRIWDLSLRKDPVTISAIVSVEALAFDPSSQLLVAGFEDGTVHLYDVATGAELQQFKGHAAPVDNVSFSPDGKVALSSGNDGIVRVWDFSRAAGYAATEQRHAAMDQLRSDPGNVGALLTMGRWYAFRGKWDWAGEFLKKAQTAGRDVSALTLARCDWSMGNLELAEQEMRQAMKRQEASEAYLKLCLFGILREWAKSPEWMEKKKAAAALVQSNRLDDALNQYTQILSVLPDDVDCLVARATLYAHAGRFREALADDAHEIDVDPRDRLWRQYRTACLRLYLGDVEGYRRDARQLSVAASMTLNPSTAEQAAKTPLLAPVAGEDLSVSREFIDRAQANGMAHKLGPYFQFTKGLAEYRAGHFDAAIELLTDAEKNFSPGPTKAAAQLLLAMTRQGMGQAKEANELLTVAVQEMEIDVPKTPSAHNETIEDWLICQIIRREAESLIRAK